MSQRISISPAKLLERGSSPWDPLYAVRDGNGEHFAAL